MKIRRLAVVWIAALIFYSSMPLIGTRAVSADVCCGVPEDCASGYACDMGGDACNPQLQGHCVKAPEPSLLERLWNALTAVAGRG